MQMTVTGDGWLGIVPRAEDYHAQSRFLALREGYDKENWVLVDLLSVYHQLGVDVFNRDA